MTLLARRWMRRASRGSVVTGIALKHIVVTRLHSILAAQARGRCLASSCAHAIRRQQGQRYAARYNSTRAIPTFCSIWVTYSANSAISRRRLPPTSARSHSPPLIQVY